MPSIRRKFDPTIGPIIQIGIAQPDSFAQRTDLDVVGVDALLDTGAARTCITAEVARRAGLRVLGKTPISSVHGVKDANVYYADLMLFFGESLYGSAASIRIDGYHEPKVAVIEFVTNSRHFSALIGRDVLCKCEFLMTKDGYFVLTR
jgi:hypothetical protein